MKFGWKVGKTKTCLRGELDLGPQQVGRGLTIGSLNVCTSQTRRDHRPQQVTLYSVRYGPKAPSFKVRQNK